MDHKLRVLVRLDVDRTHAVLEVGGCLTGRSCQALFPIIRRTSSLIDGLGVTVDLSAAEHIDGQGLEQLEHFTAGELVDTTSPNAQGFDGSIKIVAPAKLPECRARKIGRPRAEPVAA